MNRILAMALKDLRLISRDWLGMFFIFALPVAMGIFFGTIAGSFGGDDDSGGKVAVAVVDEDQSEITKKFVQSLRKNEQMVISELPRGEAADRVRRGQLLGMIVLTDGFGETAGVLWEEPPTMILGLDPSRRAESAMLQGYLMQAMGDLIGSRFMDPQGMRSLIGEAKQELSESPDVPSTMRPLLTRMMVSLETFLTDLENLQDEQSSNAADAGAEIGFQGLQFANFENLDVTRQVDPNSPAALVQKLRSPWDISFPQASLWGVLACAACFAATLVREKVRGTLVRLQAAPLSGAHIVAGKALACFLAVMAVLVLMIVLGVALGMRPRSWPLLTIASLAVAYCFVGVMMLMSCIGRTEEAVAGASWGANMMMAMFGGGMIPLAFLPGFMQTLSHLSPVKWAILSLEGAIWRGFSLPEMVLPLGVLLVVGSVCLAGGTAIIRRRMEQT